MTAHYQWNPIDTAPRDGRYIIASRFRDGELKWISHSRWITAAEIAEIEGGDECEFDPGWTSGSDEDEPAFPTHWLELVPPVGAAGAKQ